MKALRLIALSAGCLGLSAFATPVLDQNQPLIDGGYAFIVATPNPFQSFQQTGNNISGGGFHLNFGWGSGIPSTFTIGVYGADPTTNPGSLLASGTAVGTQGNWVDAFWAPLGVAPGTTLYLAITNLTLEGYVNSYKFGNVYALGSAGVPGDANFGGGYYDTTFRTYSESTYSPAVPDGGSSIVMFGAALASLVALRNKFVCA